jgi:hypothetical protein
METPAGARGYEGFGGRIGRTWSESEPWWPPQATAPAGAPNIVVVLMDDLGYSDIGPFSSEIAMSNLDQVAMPIGLAPYEGIDVGIDRRGPVHWGVYERHGAFPYSGDLQNVTYTPGEIAPYDPVVVARAIQEAAPVYD